MEIIIGIALLLIVIFIAELQDSKEFRSKVRKVIGWVALLSWTILGNAILLLQYIGVWVVYVCVPTGIISTLLWGYLLKHRNA